MFSSFSFPGIILMIYNWSSSSMTFSLRMLSKGKEGEKDGVHEERLLIFKKTEGEKEGCRKMQILLFVIRYLYPLNLSKGLKTLGF